MPKLRDRTPTPDDRFRAALAENAALLHISPQEAIERMGVPKTTYYKRRRVPETLTLGELRRIAKEFRFSGRQLCAIVGVPYGSGEEVTE